MRSPWNASLIGAPWDEGAIGAPQPPELVHGCDGRDKPPIERKHYKHYWNCNVQWRAHSIVQWSDSESTAVESESGLRVRSRSRESERRDCDLHSNAHWRVRSRSRESERRDSESRVSSRESSWRAREEDQVSGSESERSDSEFTSRESEDYGVSKWTPLLGALEPGEAAGYDQPSSDHVVHLANACEAHNENRYEVVIICNVHNVNAYRRRVAGLLKKYGGATQRCSEGAVKDDNHKEEESEKEE